MFNITQLIFKRIKFWRVMINYNFFIQTTEIVHGLVYDFSLVVK